MDMIVSALPEPCFYFPMRSGRYTVAPGLFPLETAFGNGKADRCLFQFDNRFPRYRANLLACRAERLNKYVCGDPEVDPQVAQALLRLMILRLPEEHPTLFSLDAKERGTSELFCHLTDERIVFDPDCRLIDADDPPYGPPYHDLFDAIGSQIPEDIAMVEHASGGGDRLCALHLCAPSHWAAEEKIGKPFVAVHAPVPHFERIAAATDSLIGSVIARGPFVRFAWSLDFDDRLNQHPIPPPGQPIARDVRRHFDPLTSPLFLRVERQGLWGINTANAYLFTIRVYQYDVRTLCQNRADQEALLAALMSMSEQSRQYKGLADVFDRVVTAINAM